MKASTRLLTTGAEPVCVFLLLRALKKNPLSFRVKKKKKSKNMIIIYSLPRTVSKIINYKVKDIFTFLLDLQLQKLEKFFEKDATSIESILIIAFFSKK